MACGVWKSGNKADGSKSDRLFPYRSVTRSSRAYYCVKFATTVFVPTPGLGQEKEEKRQNEQATRKEKL